MDRLSRAALWTLAAAAFAASGCANILGFKDFSDDAGLSSDPQSSSNLGGGSTVASGGSSGSTAGVVTTGSVAMSDSSTHATSIGTSSGTGSTKGSTASSTSSMSTSSSRTSTSSSSASSTGGGTAGPCTFGTARNGDGSFTWYYFGQGTYKVNGNYRTACGYSMPPSQEVGSGQQASDTLTNVANTAPAKNTYFAAIPAPSSADFSTVTSCGACVEITGQNGTKIVATIVDECPLANNPLCTNGHLDLSTQAFDQLGYSGGSPNGTTWKFVACPVTGNIQAIYNSSGQVYLQNSVYPISAVNGQPPTNYGYFNVSPGRATITSSAVNETLTINIPGSDGDTGGNFTVPSGCY